MSEKKGVEHHHLDGEIARATGKRYEIDTSGLTPHSARELTRLIRDLKEETASVKRQARTQPWRFH